MTALAIITLPFIFYFALLTLVYVFIFFLKYNKVPLIKGISIATRINVQYKLELNSEQAYLFICDRAGGIRRRECEAGPFLGVSQEVQLVYPTFKLLGHQKRF